MGHTLKDERIFTRGSIGVWDRRASAPHSSRNNFSPAYVCIKLDIFSGSIRFPQAKRFSYPFSRPRKSIPNSYACDMHWFWGEITQETAAYLWNLCNVIIDLDQTSSKFRRLGRSDFLGSPGNCPPWRHRAVIEIAFPWLQKETCA